MKRFNQNEIRANGGAGELNIRPLSPGKSAQRRYTTAGAAIFVIIILHFVSQFIFLQSEKTSPKTEALNHQSVQVKPENEQNVEDKALESAAKKPDAVLPVVQPEPKAVPSRVVIKKKESRESKTERLRRAEKFLTGV